ncbi:Hypothetical protein I5071_87760 [Sandaracinus amylolyticus]|nr:Hypothetical protein I5071_87760 [Sandaracinus amylolyticus]
MHRTLTAGVASPPRPEWGEQKGPLDAFRLELNEVRWRSERWPRLSAECASLAGHDVDPEYPDDFEVRRPRKSGGLCMDYGKVGLGVVLAEECIGIPMLVDETVTHDSACTRAPATCTPLPP